MQIDCLTPGEITFVRIIELSEKYLSEDNLINHLIENEFVVPPSDTQSFSGNEMINMLTSDLFSVKQIVNLIGASYRHNDVSRYILQIKYQKNGIIGKALGIAIESAGEGKDPF